MCVYICVCILLLATIASLSLKYSQHCKCDNLRKSLLVATVSQKIKSVGVVRRAVVLPVEVLSGRRLAKLQSGRLDFDVAACSSIS